MSRRPASAGPVRRRPRKRRGAVARASLAAGARPGTDGLQLRRRGFAPRRLGMSRLCELVPCGSCILLGHQLAGAEDASAQLDFSAVSTLISTRRFLAWLSGSVGSAGRSQPMPSTLNRLGSRSVYFCSSASLMALARFSDSSLTRLGRHLALHRAVGVPFDDDPRGAELAGQLGDLLQHVLRRSGRTAPRPSCRRSSW